MQKPPETAGSTEQEIDVANQGTQAINESQREDFSVQNEEEWAQAVKDIIEK